MKNRLLLLLVLASCVRVHAEFAPAFVQRGDYWADGRAEFNIYEAKIVRYDQPRDCEVIHILVREPFDPKQLVKPDQSDRPGMIPVLKLNQILHIPTGIYVYQQMHSNFWRVDDGALVKFTLTSNDSCGNTFKSWKRDGNTATYAWHTYWDGMADGEKKVRAQPGTYFYDELPMRVRTIDFETSKSGGFDIQLAPGVIKSKKDDIAFTPARVSYEKGGEEIVVKVASAAGTDTFTLAPEFPYLLRTWKMAGGGELKLKRSLKVDYWNYHAPGDKERALAEPGLRNE